jgi:hypothetical protein
LQTLAGVLVVKAAQIMHQLRACGCYRPA